MRAYNTAIMAPEKPAWEIQYMKDHAAQTSSGPVTFTTEQRKMNLELLQRVYALMPCPDAYKFSDCDLLYRFLIGKHWNIAVAEQFFRDYVTMRVEKKLDGIVGEQVAPALEETVSPTFGTSVDGMPILWISPEPEKLMTAVKNFSSDEVIRTQIRVMEMTRLAQHRSGKDRNLCVIDLAKISVSTMNSTVMGFVRTLSKVLQEYFPEVFRRLIVFNTGWAVTGIWKVLKPFVDARVQDKIKFFNSPPSVKSLSEYVPANQVLPRYGGASPSNTVSVFIDEEMMRIRKGTPATAAPATSTSTTATTAVPPAASLPVPDGSPSTAGKEADALLFSDSASIEASPAPETTSQESPRLLDVEEETPLKSEQARDDEPHSHEDTAHDSELFTARADSCVIDSDASGSEKSPAERLLVAPNAPPRRGLSMLTTGAELPTQPIVLRGLSAIYDGAATANSFADIDSCELHSIESGSDDYDHLEQSFSAPMPLVKPFQSLSPPPAPMAATSAPVNNQQARAPAGGAPTATNALYSSDARGSTDDDHVRTDHMLAIGSGSVLSPRSPLSPALRDSRGNTSQARGTPPTRSSAAASPSVVQINLTQRGDRSVLGYSHNTLIAECRDAHILSTTPPPLSSPTGFNTATTAKSHGNPRGDNSLYVVGQLLLESGHPIHEFVLVCDAQRRARFIVRKSRFRSRLTIFQVVGDALVATDERGNHYIEGERAKLAVGVPHRNGVSSDWMLYGEDLSSTARVRRKVRGLAHSIRLGGGSGAGAETETTAEDAHEESHHEESAQGSRQLLAECHGQTANFFGILAGTHPLVLFTLFVAIDRMWHSAIDTIQLSSSTNDVSEPERSLGSESRDVVRSVKAFFRSGQRAATTQHADPASGESARHMSPTSSGGARRLFKKLTGKE